MSYNFEHFGDIKQCTRQQDEPDMGDASNVVAHLAIIVPPVVNHRI